MESRRIATWSQVPPLAGLETAKRARSTCRVRSGGLQDCVHGTVRPLHPAHPLRPLQGLRGPLRWQGLLPEQSGLAGYTPYYPPGIPTRIPVICRTRPVQHAWPSPRCTSTLAAVTPGTRTYDRFGHLVGEPRGVEYRSIFRVQDGILNGSGFNGFTRDYDWNGVLRHA